MSLKSILIGMLVASLLLPTAFAQEPKEFGFKVFPEKLVKDTDGLLQIYTKAGNTPIPFDIKNLIVTSSNSDIIEISEINQINDFITTIQLKTLDSGSSEIAIAAPGFTSQEFTVKVYDIKQGEQKILLKTIPDKFTVNGPSDGYFSVTLADVEGNPTPAKQDTFISMTTSNSQIIKLATDYVTIKQGDYFTTGKFEITDTGKAVLYANNQDIGTAESEVEVLETNENDLQIELFVIPNKISNFASSGAYAIVQLQNSEGEPVKATEDIPVTLQIHHSNAPKNERSPDISALGPLSIPKGSTNGFVKLSVLAGLEDIYEISISAENYLTSDSKELETIFSGDISDLNTVLETIPIALTGSKEFIGVIYPINSEGVAMVNTKPIENKIDSSNKDTISVPDIKIKTGEGAKLVYADLGFVQTNEVELTLLGEQRETFTPNIFAPEKSELSLNVEPLIPQAIPGTSFPLIMYMTENNAAWYFPKTSNVFVSPNDYLKASQLTVTEGQSSIILPAQSLKEGKDTIEFGINEYTTNLEWDSKNSNPANVELTYANELLSGVDNIVSLQIVDSNGSPMFASRDMEFNLSVNDEKISIPDKVTIKSGEYN
ncbi:MAG: hypothetical protein R3327_05925, partial [Nitrosopumilaceae archaeon]|nr:hypothetical protein [Nitrosopumilaceae archaeon]